MFYLHWLTNSIFKSPVGETILCCKKMQRKRYNTWGKKETRGIFAKPVRGSLEANGAFDYGRTLAHPLKLLCHWPVVPEGRAPPNHSFVRPKWPRLLVLKTNTQISNITLLRAPIKTLHRYKDLNIKQAKSAHHEKGLDIHIIIRSFRVFHPYTEHTNC